MLRLAMLFLLLLSVPVVGQTPDHAHHPGMTPPVSGTAIAAKSRPTEPGQSAFATIQEIVILLEADPATDWKKVDIEALRQHLIDMDNVTLHAVVKAEPFPGGRRFIVSGSAPVIASVQRMTRAYAMTMEGVGSWHIDVEQMEEDVAFTVTGPAADAPRIAALGFIGIMTRGSHHQDHHLMIARGEPMHH